MGSRLAFLGLERGFGVFKSKALEALRWEAEGESVQDVMA